MAWMMLERKQRGQHSVATSIHALLLRPPERKKPADARPYVQQP